MKIVLEREEVDKIIMDYLQSQGKIEENKNTTVSWNIIRNRNKESDINISIEQ